MNGTLALWYERTASADEVDVNPSDPVVTRPSSEQINATRPAVELHFNLWRDLESRTNSLDIGFRLKEVGSLRRFYLYVPAPLVEGQLQDLSGVLRFGQTLNAVFNDVVELGSLGDDYYETRVGELPHVTVHWIEIGSDVRVEALEREDGGAGTLIVFTDQLCARIRNRATVSRDDQYLRIRLHLRDASRELFSQEITANDGFFVPSSGHLELTEFRFNEKRSYPARVAELARERSFRHDCVHYFLIRDLQHQLIEQHAPFRKIRRLEASLWRHYLVGEAPSQAATHFERIAARMVIYHWREVAGRDTNGELESIENFVAFASFRASRSHLLFYAIAVVLLGGMGSAAAAFLASYLADWLGGFAGLACLGDAASPPNSANAAAFSLLGFLVIVLVFIASVNWVRLNDRLQTKRVKNTRSGSNA